MLHPFPTHLFLHPELHEQKRSQFTIPIHEQKRRAGFYFFRGGEGRFTGWEIMGRDTFRRRCVRHEQKNNAREMGGVMNDNVSHPQSGARKGS
jgi:hypothetical protein